MNARRFVALACLWASLAVVLGALGAHGLENQLAQHAGTRNWETAVDYHFGHALALLLFGLYRERHPGSWFAAWSFLFGSALFSGSLYGLALGGPGMILGPLTPAGGLLLIAGWVMFALTAIRH